MKKVSLKISLIFAISLILLIMLSTNVTAANANLEIIKSNEDYIIFIEGYESKPFKFAFSNDISTVKEDLHFYPNWTDSNNINVACLDNEMSINLSQDVFIWLVDSESNSDIAIAQKVDLSTVFSTEEVKDIENLTKIIKVDTNQSTTKTEKVQDTFFYSTTGKVVITDDSNCTYRYDLIKVTDSSNIKSFLNELKNCENTYSSMSMFSKLQTIRNIENNFSNLLNSANWKNVVDMTINQPNEADNGDQYVILIQKLSNGEVVKSDLKILNCYKTLEQQKASSTVPVAVASALPVTADSMVLYVSLAIVLVIIVIIAVRIFFVKSKNENKE